MAKNYHVDPEGAIAATMEHRQKTGLFECSRIRGEQNKRGNADGPKKGSKKIVGTFQKLK